MTVPSSVPINTYQGNSSTTRFDFDFLIENPNELVVKHFTKKGVETLLTLGIDYSINQTGNAAGSYITFPLQTSSFSVLARNEHISLSLELPIKQESAFGNSTYFNFDVLEWTFDYIIRILQILSQKMTRCFKVSEASNIQPNNLIEELFVARTDAVAASDSAISASNNATAKEASVIAKQQEFNTTYASKKQEFDETFENCMSAILNESEITHKSNIDLNNLTEEGENHFVNYTHVSDCIIKQPKQIIYTFESNIFTLKTGSIVIVPLGTNQPEIETGNYFKNNNFKVADVQYADSKAFLWIELQTDISFEFSGNDNGLLCVDFENSSLFLNNSHYSGTSTSGISSQIFIFYDTSDNICKQYNNISHVVTRNTVSLPFVNINYKKVIELGSVTYTGSVLFINKGIKYLIPNGKNDDGSNNSIKKTLTALKTVDVGNSFSAAQYLRLYINDENGISLYSLNRINRGLYADMPYSIGAANAHIYYAYDVNRYYYTTGSTTANWSERKITSLTDIYFDGTNIAENYTKSVYYMIDYNNDDIKANDGYYHYGDTYSLNHGETANYAASLTTSKANLRFTVPLPKSIARINTISVDSLVISARVPSGGYLPEISWNALSEATVTVYRNDDFNISIVVNSATRFASATNNIALVVSCNSLVLSFA